MYTHFVHIFIIFVGNLIQPDYVHEYQLYTHFVHIFIIFVENLIRPDYKRRCKFQVTITLFSFAFFLLLFRVHVHVNLSLHVVFLQNEDMKYQNDNLAITIAKCKSTFCNYCIDIEKKSNDIFLCFFYVAVNDYLYNRVGCH